MKGHTIFENWREKHVRFKNKLWINSAETMIVKSFNLFYQMGGSIAYLR